MTSPESNMEKINMSDAKSHFSEFRYTHNLWDITQNASAKRRFELKSAAGRVFRRESMAKLGISPTLDPFFGSEYWITEQFHNGPTPPGQPGGHRRRGAAVLKRTLSAFPWDRFGELDAQALMVA